MTPKLLLIGGGGHCRSVLDCVQALHKYAAVGIVARDAANAGALEQDPDLPAPVVGTDAQLPDLRAAGWTHAFVTIGSVGDAGPRRRTFDAALDCGFTLPAIIDPTAVIAARIHIGAGVFVGKRAVVNTGTRIEEGAIINTGAIIEHDCRVGAFAHVSPCAVLCGMVLVGEEAHVGAGAVARQGIRIGARALVGAGSVVVRDVPEGARAYGNPCRVMRGQGAL